MENNIPQNEHDEIIFVSDATQSISIHKNHSNNNAILESKEIISCIFCFSYKQSEYSNVMRDMLIRLLYTEGCKEQICTKDLFYKDNENGIFEVYIQSDSNSILTFANTLSESLPLGLDFSFKEIKPLNNSDFIQAKNDNSNSIDTINLKQDSILHVPNVLELHALLDKNNKAYRLISPFVRLNTCNLSCFIESYGSNNMQLLTHLQLQDFIQNELIEVLAAKLMQDKNITLQRNNTIFTLSLEPLDSVKSLESSLVESIVKNKSIPFVLFGVLDIAKSYLRMSEAQKNMLASFEKPFIKMQCKEVFAKELGSYVVFAGLPHDIIVLLLLSYLQEKYEKGYLFYTQKDSKTQDSNISLESQNMQLLHYTDTYPDTNNIKSHSYIVSENIYISHFQTHSNLSDLLTYNHTESARFIVYLSTKNSSAFLIQNPQNKEMPLQQILNISFSTDLYHHLKVLHGYKNGDKLIYNFAKANKDIVEKWHLKKEELESLGISDIIPHSKIITDVNKGLLDSNPTNNLSANNLSTNNLLVLYSLVAKILDIDTSILFEANRCVRDRGPRIDYKLIKQNDCIVLDYARLLRSVMSFKLAGVENELLCYGVIDSLAEFIGTLSGDMLLNYGIQEVFICGDLLLWQCFLDKIVKALPKNMKATFPQFGGVDFGLV